MTEPGFRWLHTPAEWQMAMAAEASMQRFERLTLELVTSPGVSADEAREAAAGLLRMAAYAAGPPPLPPVVDEPFLRPDYIAAPVVGGPVTPFRRAGGAA